MIRKQARLSIVAITIVFGVQGTAFPKSCLTIVSPHSLPIGLKLLQLVGTTGTARKESVIHGVVVMMRVEWRLHPAVIAARDYPIRQLLSPQKALFRDQCSLVPCQLLNWPAEVVIAATSH